MYLHLIFDNVDGQISRTTNKASYLGKFLDGLLDTVCHATFPTLIAIVVFNYTNDSSIIVFGMLSTIFNLFYLYLIIRYSHALNIVNKKNKTSSNLLIKYAEGRMLVDWYDIKYFSFIIFLIFSAEILFIYYCLFVNILIFLLLFFIKIYKAIDLLNIHKVSKSKK